MSMRGTSALPSLKVPFGEKLTDVAANEAEANRQFVLNVHGVAFVTVVINFAHSAATAITMVMEESVNGGVNYGRTRSVDIASGTGTLSAFTWSQAVSGDDDIAIRLDVRTLSNVRLTFAATGGGGSDIFTSVTAQGSVH